jgi:hypothetical protein
MHRFTYSNVVATLALIAAVGGGATAGAAALHRNSVGTAQIRDRSVQVRDLARTARPPSRARIASVVTDTMTSSDVLSALSTAVRGEPGAQGPAGAPGAQGPSGVVGAVVRDAFSDTVSAGQETGVTARCLSGERVIGGGGRFEGGGQTAATVAASYPLADADQGWTVVMDAASGSQPGRVHAFAICAQAS